MMKFKRSRIWFLFGFWFLRQMSEGVDEFYMKKTSTDHMQRTIHLSKIIRKTVEEELENHTLTQAHLENVYNLFHKVIDNKSTPTGDDLYPPSEKDNPEIFFDSTLLGIIEHLPRFLSDELIMYLLEMFWILHETIQDGRTSVDGKASVGGRTYDLRKMGSYCCSFG